MGWAAWLGIEFQILRSVQACCEQTLIEDFIEDVDLPHGEIE